MTETQAIRLDRIEGKIDNVNQNVNDGFVTIARMEERIISLFKDNEAFHKQIAALEESFNKRIDTLEIIVAEQSKTINTQNNLIGDTAKVTKTISRLFWAAVTAIPTGWISLFFYMMRE
jgi:hypothetical protein